MDSSNMWRILLDDNVVTLYTYSTSDAFFKSGITIPVKFYLRSVRHINPLRVPIDDEWNPHINSFIGLLFHSLPYSLCLSIVDSIRSEGVIRESLLFSIEDSPSLYPPGYALSLCRRFNLMSYFDNLRYLESLLNYHPCPKF